MRPIILYDGSCRLCSRTVQFVTKHSIKQADFQFYAIESKKATRLLTKYKIPLEIDSLVLIVKNQCFIKSKAVFRLTHFLKYPYRLVGIFSFLPIMITDYCYDYVAQHRYSWFGRHVICDLPQVKSSTKTSEIREI